MPSEPAESQAPKLRGRPKGAKDYICLECKHGFRAVNPAGCPDCSELDNFVLKKDYNPDRLPD